MDPEMVAELEAIDATLRGDAVDPIHAELAELSLLLAVDRPRPSALFASYLDDRVATRFAPIEPPARSASLGRWWARRPVLGFAAAGLAAAAIVVVALGSGGGTSLNGASSSSSSSATTTASASSGPAKRAAAPRGVRAGLPATVDAGQTLDRARKATPGFFSGATDAVATTPSVSAPGSGAASAAGSIGKASPADAPYANATLSPAPVSNGRAEIQSAQLQLVSPESRIDTVSQELFTVVGNMNGIVKSSQITAGGGTGGYATFSLSIPSGNLAETMTELSELRYAHVATRTDATQDVNDQLLSDQRKLADARALRTSLLKQLAAADTDAAITSLTAQIRDAEASISSDEATLGGLNHQIDYSNLSVQINAGPILTPVPVTAHGSSGFTLGKAAHDAGRVLTVAAGVALVTLAALVPFALLAALGLWIAWAVRRRRREQALDTA